MRQFDLIVFGATSFVGKLVVQHILETHGVGRGLSWAIAGRSNTRLNDVLRRHGDAASHVAVLVADANNLDGSKPCAYRPRSSSRLRVRTLYMVPEGGVAGAAAEALLTANMISANDAASLVCMPTDYPWQSTKPGHRA
jgi:hypothetical protein